MQLFDKIYPAGHPDLPAMNDQLSLWSAYFGKLLLEHVPLRKNMNMLDVGCGTGFPSLELAQICGKTCRVTGIDTSEPDLNRARWKAKAYKLDNVSFLQKKAEELPFENDTFDLIVSNLGLNNFNDPPAVLKACYRVSKRGAHIACTTNLSGHFREFYAIFESVLKELGKAEFLPALQQQEAHRGSDESIRELFEDSGYSVSKVIRERFFMRFADGSAMLNHFLVNEGFLPGWLSVLPLCDQEAVFEAIEAKMNAWAEWDGELKMAVPMLYIEAVK